MASWSDVIRRLASRRAALTAEIERIDDLMRSVQELQRILPNQVVPNDLDAEFQRSEVDDQIQLGFATSAHSAQLQPQAAQRVRNIVPPADIARFARETLIAEGKPLKRGALLRAMERRGLPMAGGDPAKNLGTILWRNADQFVNLDNLGYWPKDIALHGVYEPAGQGRKR